MDVFTYEEFVCGDTITHVAEVCLQLCKEKNCDVKFTFNGIDILVTKDDVCSNDIVHRYNMICKERSEAYEQSPEGVAARERKERELQDAQSSMNNCVNSLVNINSVQNLLKWLTVFIPLADRIGVTYDKGVVLDKLSLFGFQSGECVGGDMEDINQRIRWLFGQVIEGIESCGCPHPMGVGFAEEIIEILNREEK